MEKKKDIPTTQLPFDEPSATTFQKGCTAKKLSKSGSE